MESLPNKVELAEHIEHTLLKATASLHDIEQLCKEAVAFGFYGVCVPPYYVSAAARFLQKTKAKIITVIGFPMGYNTMQVKADEAKKGMADGAHEIDMVVNLAAVKSELYAYVQDEIRSLTTLCHLHNRRIKVIIETGLLTPEEMEKLCKICSEERVDFVKTSTGILSRGASLEDIQMLRQCLPSQVHIKASGGIKTASQALELIAAGASRIGTSAGADIMNSVA